MPTEGRREMMEDRRDDACIFRTQLIYGRKRELLISIAMAISSQP